MGSQLDWTECFLQRLKYRQGVLDVLSLYSLSVQSADSSAVSEWVVAFGQTSMPPSYVNLLHEVSYISTMSSMLQDESRSHVLRIPQKLLEIHLPLVPLVIPILHPLVMRHTPCLILRRLITLPHMPLRRHRHRQVLLWQPPHV